MKRGWVVVGAAGALAVLATCIRELPAAGAAEAPAYTDHNRLLVYRDTSGGEYAVKTAADWANRRAHILAAMQLVMGPLPGPERRVPLDVHVVEEISTDKFVRRKLSFASEAGDRVPAYLLIPRGLNGRTAAVLCLHQTTKIGKAEPAGLGGNPNLHFAAHLAERGYVTLAPDYPNFAEHSFDVYGKGGYGSATMKAIWDNMRAVDLLQSLREVDPDRIGAIGHSLGGHNTLFTAAFDERIKVAVSNCGFTAFPAYYKGNLTGWSHKGYMPRIAAVYNKDPKQMPFDFPEVLAAIAPRAVLASAPLRDSNFEVSGVRSSIAAAMPVFELLGVPDKLAANYPDSAHDFPPDARTVAYDWIDRWLKNPRTGSAGSEEGNP